MPRPFWSGQIQISLVSFGVNLFPAVDAKSEIHVHQLSRKTGERIHHQKVSGDDGSDGSPVDNDDIVIGWRHARVGFRVRGSPIGRSMKFISLGKRLEASPYNARVADRAAPH